MIKLRNCPDCGVEAGNIHHDGCDIEQCSICGQQRISCDCDDDYKKHDKQFSRWNGFWPGELEAKELGIDLNKFYSSGIYKKVLIKP